MPKTTDIRPYRGYSLERFTFQDGRIEWNVYDADSNLIAVEPSLNKARHAAKAFQALLADGDARWCDECQAYELK